MKLGDILSMAIYNLWRRRIRTSLTTLAVVIGAALVAIIVSLGDGLQTFIERQFGTIFPDNVVTTYSGADLFSFTGSVAKEITDEKDTLFRAFSAQDYRDISEIPGVERIDFSVTLITNSVQPEGSSKKYTVTAFSGTADEAALVPLLAGDAYGYDDSGVCLISYDYIKAFGWPDAESAIGKQITLAIGKRNIYSPDYKEFTLTMVGVMEKDASVARVLVPTTDAIAMGRFSYDDPALFTPQRPGYQLQLKIAEDGSVEKVASTLRAMGFQALTAAEVLQRLNTVFAVVRIALSFFGGIALIVAAIGIINTLMMAIHERTREIGVMKALGATRGAIRLMFTIEGGLLGFFGGIIGALTALAVGYGLNRLGEATFLSDFPGFQLSVFSPLLALGVIALTTIVSLLAGLYPANRAARLNTVDSLRYE